MDSIIIRYWIDIHSQLGRILLTNHVWPRNIHLWPLAHRLEVCRACRVQPFSSALLVGLLREPWPGTSEAADHNLTAGFAEGVSKQGKPIHAHMYITYIYIFIYLFIHLFIYLFIYLVIYLCIYLCIYVILYIYIILYYIYIYPHYVLYIYTRSLRATYTQMLFITHIQIRYAVYVHTFPVASQMNPNIWHWTITGRKPKLVQFQTLALPNRLQDERPRFREWTWTKDTQAAPKREPLQFTTNYHEIITMVGYRSNHWTTPHGGFLSHGGSPQITQVMDDHDSTYIVLKQPWWLGDPPSLKKPQYITGF